MSDTHTDELSEIMDVKEPITYDEQVKRIAAKGFIIENPDSFFAGDRHWMPTHNCKSNI